MARLSDLTKNLADMTEEQLMAHVESIRHNKYVAKPAVAKRKADVVKKEKNTQIRSVNKIVDKMTPEQRQQLLQLLDEGDTPDE